MSELPVGWAECLIGNVAKIAAGGTPPSKDVTNFTTDDSGVSWITPADLSGYRETYISRGARDLSAKGFSACSAVKIPPGSVLFSSRAPIGYVAIAANEVSTNQGFKSFVLPSELNNHFVYHYLKHVKPVAEAMATGTTFKELSGSAISQLPFVIAPINEQKRIADKLDVVLARVDACRDRLDRIPVILKRFRQSVLAAATSGKLTEDWRAERILATQPQKKSGNVACDSAQLSYKVTRARLAGWREVRLADIADVQGGVTKDAKKQSATDEEVPYLRVANVQRGHLDLSEMKSIRVPAGRLAGLLLEPGDILFNEGGDIDKLGRGWIWEGQIKRCSFQNHVFRARLYDKRNQPKYISWWGNFRGLEYFLRGGKQTTNLASINKTMLSNLPISLPPPDEQTEIVRRVDALFTYADRLEARYTTARAQVEKLTPATLAMAFRGELVPQDPNDEPASVLLERIRAARLSSPAKLRGRNRIAKGGVS